MKSLVCSYRTKQPATALGLKAQNLKSLLSGSLAAFCILLAGCQIDASAQAALDDAAKAEAQPPAFVVKPPVPTTRSDRESIELIAETEGRELWETFFDQVMVRNITRPAVYPVLPANGQSNGKAVIVVPGGGYRFVAIENEGFPVADQLAEEGYTAFVLKYRTFETPAPPQEFLEETSAAFRQLGKTRLPDHPPAVEDLAAAIEFVKTNCSEFHCNSEDINLVGFSAGARTIIRLIENEPIAETLKSTALIYPPMLDAIGEGPRPPMFVAMAVDDPLFIQKPLHLVAEWLLTTDEIEFHLYAHGDHGFGMSRQNMTASSWIHQYINWLALYVDQD